MTKMAPLSTLKKVDIIVEWLAFEVRASIQNRCLLEAGNRQVVRALGGKESEAAFGYTTVEKSLVFGLCIEIARMFDLGQKRPIHKQSKASFPVLAHYLAEPSVQAALVSRADDAGAVVQKHIETFLTRWAAFSASPRDSQGLARLQELRNWRYAHSIYDREPSPPTYRQLFRLSSIAVLLASYAEVAVLYYRTDYREIFRESRLHGRAFWQRFIEGAKLLDDHSDFGATT